MTLASFTKRAVPVALRVIALALLVLAVSPAPANAEGGDVVVLAPPDSPPLSPASPSPRPPPDWSPYVGRPVSATEIVVEDSPLGDVTPRPITKAHVGDAFTPALARAVLDEVLDSGLFGDAWINVVDDAPGVQLRVHGKPRKLVEAVRVELHGATAVTEDDVSREAQIDEGAELVGTDLELRTKRVAALLARRGYPDATVKIEARQTDVPTRVIALIDVALGEPRKIARRVFYAFGASSDEVAPFTGNYAVGVGDATDETALETADAALADAMQAAGYHNAAALHDVVLSGGKVTLRVRIDSGPHYSFRFEGQEHYDADALRAAAVGDSAEADLSMPRLEERVKNFYEARGFLDAEVSAEERGEPTGNARAIVFHIVEHARVKVASRAYPCLRGDDIKKLTDGGPTSATAVGREIDSFLEDELPGADLVVGPSPTTADAIFNPAGGARRDPIDLSPDTVFSPDIYDRAIAHVQELYRNEGYLSAVVGPVQVLRRKCDPKSPAGQCKPLPLPYEQPFACTYGVTGLPLAIQPLSPELSCVPDAAHGIACEPAVSLRIPIKLGPRSFMYDLAFRGAQSIDEKRLAGTALVLLGAAVNMSRLEEARRRILDLYKEEGFYYAQVALSVDKSPDQTRARIRFDVTEGERVIVRQIVIRGNANTKEDVIRRRVRLFVGQPYRTSDVRKTQERIATLNVFSSVNVTLANPAVPQKNKTVIITVAEVANQYVGPRIGFSTGEGARGGIEYGYRNLFGRAIGFSLLAQVSYLPDFLILDSTVLQNFQTLSLGQRIAGRATATLAFPDVGLGPLVRATLDMVLLQDVERYFTVLKEAIVPTLYYRPVRGVQLSLGVSGEHNNLNVFNNCLSPTPDQVAACTAANAALAGQVDTQRLLRAPAGDSYVAGERVSVSWDRRDSALNAHRGTFLGGTVEHVNSFVPDTPGEAGHFIKLSQTFGAYYPVTQKIGLAVMLRLGQILQFYSGSVTYPDRYFFMGGADSMRGWTTESMYPQDAADAIGKSNGTISASQIAIRGGNLMINPRTELRVPVFGPFETVLFFEAGNLWQDAAYPFDHGFTFRADAGSGVRLQTPVGPLALDYGINLTRNAAVAEDFGAFNFSIGVF